MATNALWLAGLVVVVARRLDKMRPAASAAAALALFVLAMANYAVVDIFSHVHRGI